MFAKAAHFSCVPKRMLVGALPLIKISRWIISGNKMVCKTDLPDSIYNKLWVAEINGNSHGKKRKD